jgi:DNA-directed RNA polymerase specialized sigma subunit
MDQKDEDKKCPMPSPKKNFEPFDVWGKAQFAMWSNIRYDFELVAELTRHKIKNTRFCLDLLQTVNEHLKNPPEKVFFDGTIKCLKYLIKNGYLDLSDLPRLTQDEKYLVELLEKYSKRLDITEVLSDIEEPTLRVMLLEYPHLLPEILKDADPLSGYLVGNAMKKNGITDLDDLLKKVDNGLNAIEVDQDKNSTEAMKCKLIYLGLLMLNNQLSITRDMGEEFAKLTNDVIENGSYTKGIFNATYVAFYGHSIWNQDKKGHLSGCDTLYLDFQLLMLPQNHMSMIYEIFLSKYVDEIGKKYFGNEYDPKGFIASLAIKMIIVILIFRTDNFLPKDEKEEVEIFNRGAFLGSLNYAVRETGDPKNPLELKQWFIDYFCDELDKRVAFLKMQIANNVGIVSMMGRQRVIYLPVFESFRFFCQRDAFLPQIIKLLKNKDIPNSVKDEIFINFTLNIQKIITHHTADVPEDEQRIKDTFILLISKTFEGLYKNVIKKIKTQSQKYYEEADFMSDASVAVIELILGFDLSKNTSFIGYLTTSLFYKMKTSSRMDKMEETTNTENSFEEGFFESIPDATDFMASLEDQTNLEKIREYIDKLPDKEREAVKKMSESNEKLNDTERKAKNRGLNKIREMMGVS